MHRTRVISAVIAIGVLAGCGATPAGPAVESITRSSTPTATPTAYELPFGMRTLTSKKAGLAFAVPRSWTMIDADRMNDPDLKSQMASFAKNMNLTPDQLRRVISQIDLMALAPSTSLKTYAEVDVVPVKMLAEIPTRESLRTQFAALNLKVLGFRDVSTPVGDGLVVEIRKVLPSQVAVYASGLFVQVHNGVVSLTVSAGTQDHSRELLDHLLPSIQDIGDGGSGGPGSTIGG